MSVLVISLSASDVTPCTGQVTSGTAKRDVRGWRRSGKTEERSGRGHRAGAVPVPVLRMLASRRVMVMVLVCWIVVVLVRVVRTGMMVAAIVGTGVIIARHPSSKAGMGMVRIPSILRYRSQ